MTVRALQCACRVKVHPLYPLHAAARHFKRVRAHSKFREQATFPLIPGEDGAVLTKQGMIQGFRGVIALTGTPVDRPGGDGVLKPRFGGHVLRVSGAQWLSKLGLAVNQIQLHGQMELSSS